MLKENKEFIKTWLRRKENFKQPMLLSPNFNKKIQAEVSVIFSINTYASA